MSKHHKIQCALGVAAALCAAPAAWAITPPGTPPTFYCDADRPANADTVEVQLNTRALGGSATDADRGNQPRWEYARETQPTASLQAAPDPLPPGMTWSFFTGHELDRYLTIAVQPGRNYPAYPGWYVGHFPKASEPPLPALHTHYLRYRFNLASTVDPTTYQITLPAGWFATDQPNLRVDDNVVGVYLNGKRMYGVNPLGSALVLGGGATADVQWKAGANELAFAVRDSGGGAMWLGIQSAQQTFCDTRVLPPTATGSVTAVPALGGVGLGLLGGLLGAAAVWRRRRSSP